MMIDHDAPLYRIKVRGHAPDKTTGYRILDPAPECCGTCRWFVAGHSGYVSGCDNAEACAEYDMPTMHSKSGWCEKWERADD